jgi:hypothetical protein
MRDSLIFLFLGFLTIFVIIEISKSRNLQDIRYRAIEVGQAQYNQQTGDFEITNPEWKYIITGEK